uniref:Uncharacterized protein n=1 Tax=Lepeophtheirus salmonis TaxID=72036 RepID=A0A0K2TKP8_LEPSM
MNFNTYLQEKLIARFGPCSKEVEIITFRESNNVI